MGIEPSATPHIVDASAHRGVLMALDLDGNVVWTVVGPRGTAAPANPGVIVAMAACNERQLYGQTLVESLEERCTIVLQRLGSAGGLECQ